MAEQGLVLVTRTEEAGRTLVEKVRELGLDAIHCAPFALAAAENPVEVAGQLRDLLPADRVIITSQEGVRRSVELVGAEAFARSLVIVPGEGTASLARELGIENVICPSSHGTSEAMLELPELTEVDGLDILILVAEGGRGLMGSVLARRDACVDRVQVYRRVRQPPPPDLDERIAQASSIYVLGASWESVNGLYDNLSGNTRRKVTRGVLIAPSRRVAEKAAALGFVRSVVANGAEDEALLAQLERLVNH